MLLETLTIKFQKSTYGAMPLTSNLTMLSLPLGTATCLPDRTDISHDILPARGQGEQAYSRSTRKSPLPFPFCGRARPAPSDTWPRGPHRLSLPRRFEGIPSRSAGCHRDRVSEGCTDGVVEEGGGGELTSSLQNRSVSITTTRTPIQLPTPLSLFL